MPFLRTRTETGTASVKDYLPLYLHCECYSGQIMLNTNNSNEFVGIFMMLYFDSWRMGGNFFHKFHRKFISDCFLKGVTCTFFNHTRAIAILQIQSSYYGHISMQIFKNVVHVAWKSYNDEKFYCFVVACCCRWFVTYNRDLGQGPEGKLGTYY